MDLYKEILINVLQGEKAEVSFPNLTLKANEIVDSVSYRALKKIKDIVRDETLNDEECFRKIEEIICVLEDIGSGGGWRHDF